ACRYIEARYEDHFSQRGAAARGPVEQRPGFDEHFQNIFGRQRSRAAFEPGRRQAGRSDSTWRNQQSRLRLSLRTLRVLEQGTRTRPASMGHVWRKSDYLRMERSRRLRRRPLSRGHGGIDGYAAAYALLQAGDQIRRSRVDQAISAEPALGILLRGFRRRRSQGGGSGEAGAPGDKYHQYRRSEPDLSG